MPTPRGLSVHAGMLDYAFALCLMEAVVDIKRRKTWPDIILLLEHPPVITLGRRATEKEILCPLHSLPEKGIGIYHVERGGLATYHGPGQLVGYLLFDLKRRQMRPGQLVDSVETALVTVLSEHGIAAERSPGHRGVWAGRHKIASIGIGVKGGISFHGFALNCSPDLSHFDLINPCGLGPHSMTSMSRLTGKSISPRTIAERIASALPKEIGFEFTDEALEKILEEVYNERPDAFTGVLAREAHAAPDGVCFNHRSAIRA